MHAGKVFKCAKGLLTLEGINEIEAAPYLHPSTKLRETSAVGTIAA